MVSGAGLGYPTAVKTFTITLQESKVSVWKCALELFVAKRGWRNSSVLQELESIIKKNELFFNVFNMYSHAYWDKDKNETGSVTCAFINYFKINLHLTHQAIYAYYSKRLFICTLWLLQPNTLFYCKFPSSSIKAWKKLAELFY